MSNHVKIDELNRGVKKWVATKKLKPQIKSFYDEIMGLIDSSIHRKTEDKPLGYEHNDI